MTSDTEDSNHPGPFQADLMAAVEGGFPINGEHTPAPHPKVVNHRPVVIVKKKNGKYLRLYDNARPPNASTRYQYYIKAPVIVDSEQLKSLMRASAPDCTDGDRANAEKVLECDPRRVRWFTTDRHTYGMAAEVGANMSAGKLAGPASSSVPAPGDEYAQVAVLALLHDPLNLFYVGHRILPPSPLKTEVVTMDADGHEVVHETNDAKACLVITVAEMYLKSKVHKARMMRAAVSSIQRALGTDNVWCSGSNKIEIRGKMPSPEKINMLSILPGLGNIRIAVPPTPEEVSKGLTTPTAGDLVAEGAGGLPVLHDQNVLCLLSGGLDSPVAAYQMMVRGCTVNGVHYLNSTSETSSVMDKNRLIAKRLSEVQGTFEMRFVDISRLQAEIVARIRPLNRTLLYKWYMLYISSILDAKSNATTNTVAVSNSRKALAAAGKPPTTGDHRHKNLLLVVGDSVGQVASQTPQNIYSLYSMQAMAAAAVCIEKVGVMRGGVESNSDDSASDHDGEAGTDTPARKKKAVDENGVEVAPRCAKATTLDRAFKDMIFKPVIAPLVGSNKDDIVAIARKIGTYELSILPGGDCCQYMMCKVGANLCIGRKSLKGSIKVIPQLTLPIVAETYRNGELETTHEEVLVLEQPFRAEDSFKGLAGAATSAAPTSSKPSIVAQHVDPENAEEDSDAVINFDVAAGGDMCPEAARAFVTAPKGNPNSLHRTGREARMAVEKVRADIANKLNSGLAGNWVNDVVGAPGAKNVFKSTDFIFTSGGTESNNIALNGCTVLRDDWSHPSTKGNLGENEETAGETRPVVQVYDAVHHETGSVRTSFPINPKADRIHVDACQALGKIDLSKIDFTNVDTIAFSSHKVNGPQGVGILYVKDAERRVKNGSIVPLSVGGTQEHSIRPGTENVQGIMGLGAALNINRRQVGGVFRQVEALLVSGLIELGCVVNKVPEAPTSGYIIHATLPPQLSGMNVSFVSYLSTVHGVEIGTGSACKSGSSEENTATFDHLVRLGVKVGGTAEAPIPHKRAIRLSYDYTVTVKKAERVLNAIRLTIAHFTMTQSPSADGNAGARVNKH